MRTWWARALILALSGALLPGCLDDAEEPAGRRPDERLDAGDATPDPAADASPRLDGSPGRDADRPPGDGAPSRDAAADIDGTPPAPDAGPDATTPADAAPPPPPERLTRRACGLTLRFTAPQGSREVLVAGEFTGWGDAPRPMSDPDGDGEWTLELAPGPGLASGGLYAYKLIVDGRWRLDPGQVRQKFHDRCVNSALLMPDCDARPEVSVERLDVGDDGALAAEVVLRAATTGTDVGAARFELDGAALPADGPGGRYALQAAGLAPGRHVLSVRAADADGREAAPVDVPFWVEPPGRAPFEWRDMTLYLLLVDRFANGDRASDRPHGPPVAPAADWNGGDLWGALAVMESGYFEALGVNAIWLSPLNRQTDRAHGGRDDDRTYTAYHGYWPTRGREVEPRFGGDEALHAFVAEAHRRGIRVLLDLINNQVHEDHEYHRANPEWFRRGCVCGIDPGCGWSERPLDCLFAPYLPDIDWRVPGAEARFVDDAAWWIETFGVDGFRVDAVKHVETTAVYNLRAELARRFEAGGHPSSRVVMLGETAVGEGDTFDDQCGERYGSGYDWISAYTGDTALDGQFDFPSHHRMQWGLLTETMGYHDLERIVRDLELRYPGEPVHVRFLGSHDSSRMASRAAQDPARECRWMGAGECARLAGPVEDPAVLARLRRAFAVLMTLPGVPLLYYGDEVALPGGNDPDSRRPMPWDGPLADVAIAPGGPTAAGAALRAWVGELGRARAASAALRRGVRVPLVAEAGLYVAGYRAGDAFALVAVNRGGAVERRDIPAPGGWPALRLAAGRGEASGQAGYVTLSVPAGEAAIFLGP